jgi:hypothetical protein
MSRILRLKEALSQPLTSTLPKEACPFCDQNRLFASISGIDQLRSDSQKPLPCNKNHLRQLRKKQTGFISKKTLPHHAFMANTSNSALSEAKQQARSTKPTQAYFQEKLL